MKTAIKFDESALKKLRESLGERDAMETFDLSKESFSYKLRESGYSLAEFAAAQGFVDKESNTVDTHAFFKRELGIDLKSAEFEEFWTSDDVRGTIPELFLDTILQAALNAMITDKIVTEIPINRESVVIRTFEDDGIVYEIAQGMAIPDDQGYITRRTHYVKKIGRGLGFTYEQQRRTPYALMQIDLARLGMRMALKKDLDVLNVLRTGIPAQVAQGNQPAQAAIATPVSTSQSNTGGSGVSAGNIVFADIVNLVTDVANRNYKADFAVMSPITYSKFLLIPQVSNFLNGGPAASKVLDSGVMSHFMGLDIYITKQMPDNEILAGQKGFAGVNFIEQPLMLEEEKIIQRQLERAQLTECYVPAVLYWQALTRMPF